MTDGLLLLLRVVLSLSVVLVLLWFLARRVGTMRSSRPGAAIAVTARQALSRHTSVAVVEVDRRRLLVGVSDAGVTLVAELENAPAPEEVPVPSEAALATAAPEPGFSERRWNRALREAQVQRSPVSGSIFDPGIWRRAWVTVRGKR